MNGFGQYDFLDRLAIASFLIGLANYDENVDQGSMQDSIKAAVNDIHAHLSKQDDLIKQINETLRRLLNE